MKPKVNIFTDGACSGNPGPGGWAYLLRSRGYEQLGSGAEAHTTNNKMELQAVISALQALKKPCSISLYTDSQYVRKGMLEWIKTWLKKGWKNSKGEAVKNQELWQTLFSLSALHEIEWHWVKGHSGDPDNDRVDAAARLAIKDL